MNLRNSPHHLLFISFFIFAAALCQPEPESQAAAAQPPAKKESAAKAKPSKVQGGAFAQSGMTDISDNPGFFTVQDLKPASGIPQDLDQRIRPVLKRLFKDAKLVEDIGEQPPARDGEVEENKLVYVVRRLLEEQDGDQLHTVLHDQEHFTYSPRLGSKPTHIRAHGKVWMSLFKSTSLRSYSLVIEVNYKTQRITVISYRLGSKYDRLM
jgi:hypothetical protein